MTLIDDGSRFVPWSSDPIIALEHIHRYRWAQQFVTDKRVLDIACGVGYGSHLLAQTARHVTSIDLDITALKHAQTHYQLPNITFVQANAEQFALAPHSIDVAICFETLEHITAQDALLASIKASLTEAGILLISTPNKQVYTDEAHFNNPHHVHEFYYDDLDALLKRYFGSTRIFGQSVVIGSVLSQNHDKVLLHDQQTVEVAVYEQTSDQRIVAAETKLEPRYFVAYCSQQPPTVQQSSFLVASQPSAVTLMGDFNTALAKSDNYARKLEDVIAAYKTAEDNARDYIARQTRAQEQADIYARELENQNAELMNNRDNMLNHIHNLENAHTELQAVHQSAVNYVRDLETRVADLDKAYQDMVTYAHNLEMGAANGHQPNLQKIYEEAVVYARSLETKIRDLEDNLRQYTDIRK